MKAYASRIQASAGISKTPAPLPNLALLSRSASNTKHESDEEDKKKPDLKNAFTLQNLRLSASTRAKRPAPMPNPAHATRSERKTEDESDEEDMKKPCLKNAFALQNLRLSASTRAKRPALMPNPAHATRSERKTKDESDEEDEGQAQQRARQPNSGRQEEPRAGEIARPRRGGGRGRDKGSRRRPALLQGVAAVSRGSL
ncbi:hypothetical protein QBC39DRAFT_346359 [Podospora conica]|nr:hypothetical protein QBC39DRAFT_346359 [Schizothecium conicum]